MSPSPLPRRLLGLLGFFVAGTFLLHVQRRAFLCDDAFISYRYALHLSEGLGLVWNPGERVEGFTNLLWVLLLAAGNRLGAPMEGLSQLLGVLSSAAIVGIMARVGLRSSPSGGRASAWLAPGLLAVHASFATWATGGLETSFFALWVVAGQVRSSEERTSGDRYCFGSAGLFALAAFTRPEGLLFAGLAGLFLLADVLRGRREVRALVGFAGTLGLAVAVLFLWRRWYFGEWLPNTFYAKVPGLWWGRGARYLWLFGQQYLVWLLAPLALLGCLRPKQRYLNLLFAVSITAHLIYLASIGGDRFGFRFLVVLLPMGYGLVAEGVRFVADRNLRRSAAALALGCLLVTFVGSEFRERRGARHGVAHIGSMARYAGRRSDEGRFLRAQIEAGNLPQQLVLCVGGAGALPYYSRWETVDRRALNDHYLARLPLGERRGLIGHERDAPYDYLQKRRVAIFDVFNKLVHNELPAQEIPSTMEFDGQPLRLHVVELSGKYLIFGSFLPEEELRSLLPRVSFLQ